ncbi:MAG: polyprenyl synthetase family protein [Candidatus Anammoxibacter sp.]
MNIEDKIKTYGNKINKLLKDLIPVNKDDYLSEPIWHHLSTGGKRIRPAICLITCEALGGNVENALHFALAVEILHNMFLMHDDIEDGDTVRRDKPTVWVKYGLANAINAGDYMLALAYRSILSSQTGVEIKIKLLDIFTMTYGKTVEGQALDINARAEKDFTVEKYMKIVELKTGYYLACGIVGGVALAEHNNSNLDTIWELGKNMGPAFQIKDDLIDLTIGKGRGGVIGSDISEGKASFPYAYTLEVANENEKNQLIRIMSKERDKTYKDDIRWVIDLYKKYDALDYAQDYAEKLIKETYKTVDRIDTKDNTIFKEIADFMVQRSS